MGIMAYGDIKVRTYGLRALAAMGLGFLAACNGEPQAACSDEPQACVQIVSQEDRTNADGETVFSVTVRNSCGREVDVMVCFEDNRLEADCRTTTALESAALIREDKALRFFGERVRVYRRYSDEVQTCRFPFSNRVTF